MTIGADESSGTPMAPAEGDAQRHGALAQAVRATGGMTLLSRVGGLVRDVVIGRIFGDTAVGSAFAAAFAIPNMFRRLFGEGALSAAFIPAYTDAHKADRRDANALASFTLAMLGLATAGLTVVIELALLAILVLAPGDPERALSLKLIMVMLPFMPLICLVAILAGMLQVHGRFGPAASGPLILNTFIVGVGAWCLLSGQLASTGVAYALGIATVLSGVTQLLWFARLLGPSVYWTRAWSSIRPRALAMLKQFVPVAIGLGTLQLNAFMDTLIAMWPIWIGPTMFGRTYPLDESSNIILALTQRLYQFPLGVFGIAVASAVFPLLARHADEPGPFLDTLRRGLRLSFFIGLPASIGLVLVRYDAIGVLFGHGGKTAWSDQSLVRSAGVLLGFAVGVWAYSLNHVLTRAFYARKDTATPMRVALWMVGLNLGLNLTLVWVPGLRESALAWATSASAIVQCGVLIAILRRRVDAPGQTLLDRETLAGGARVLTTALVMTGVTVLSMQLLPAGTTWATQLVRTTAISAVGISSYLAAARLLRVHELRWLLHRAGPPPRGRGWGVGPLILAILASSTTDARESSKVNFTHRHAQRHERSRP